MVMAAVIVEIVAIAIPRVLRVFYTELLKL